CVQHCFLVQRPFNGITTARLPLSALPTSHRLPRKERHVPPLRIRAHYCLRIARELEPWPQDHQFTPPDINTMAVVWATPRVAGGPAGSAENPACLLRRT